MSCKPVDSPLIRQPWKGSGLETPEGEEQPLPEDMSATEVMAMLEKVIVIPKDEK